MFENVKKVHIIGIGGIGTSAVAKWFALRGATVSGSDMAESGITQSLPDGVTVQIGHAAKHVAVDVDLVVYSRAVPETNPERQRAKEIGVQELSYAQFLGELSKNYKTIAISGTNGKSTTTAMIAQILIAAEKDPTVFIGTQVPGWEHGNLRAGEGAWLVVEACEHMASMLEVQPDTAVITNIEEDHLDYYRDIDHIRETFQQWIDCRKTCAHVVLNARDEQSKQLDAKYVSYFDVENREASAGKQTFDVAGVEVTLAVPGAFNAQNAAAALTAARVVGVEDDVALQALAEFKGTWRRFEHVGALNGAPVYSDYAHHPTACEGTVKAFKEFFPDRRLVVVFEPHQHSRTHELFEEFTQAFDDADVVIFSEIYEVAGRTEEHFESSQDLADAVRKRETVADVRYAADLVQAEALVRDIAQEGDVIVCMGAGTIDQLARNLV